MSFQVVFVDEATIYMLFLAIASVFIAYYAIKIIANIQTFVQSNLQSAI